MNFEFYNSTQLIFGAGTLARLGEMGKQAWQKGNENYEAWLKGEPFQENMLKSAPVIFYRKG